MSGPLLVEQQAGIVRLSLNRADRHNALNRELLTALVEVLTKLQSEQSCRVVLLQASGASFCSGLDLAWLKQLRDMDHSGLCGELALVARSCALLNSLPAVSIAQVNGPAYGGGLGLLASCDFVIADQQARFAFTECRLGLVPAMISPFVIARIGAWRAQQYFLSADQFDASEALDSGLIDQAFPQVQLASAVEQHTQSLLRAGPQAVSRCKRLLARYLPIESMEMDELVAITATAVLSDEARQGLDAFFQHSSPPWFPEHR